MVYASVILLVLAASAVAAAHAAPDCVMMRKATTQEFYCVFPDSVPELYERGWGTPGKAWADVCVEYTMLRPLSPDCIPRPSWLALDVCVVPPEVDPCIHVEARPVTARDCLDMYTFGYIRVTDLRYRMDIQEYAGMFCDLLDDAGSHGEECRRWWQMYLGLAEDHPESMSEGRFISVFCLESIEPDWDSWGSLVIGGHDSLGEGLWGPLQAFSRLAFQLCHEALDLYRCVFEQPDGTVSEIECGEIEYPVFNSLQFVRDPDTLKYSCMEAPKPRLDCPEIASAGLGSHVFKFRAGPGADSAGGPRTYLGSTLYNSTHFLDAWLDEAAMRFVCSTAQCHGGDCSWSTTDAGYDP